MGAMTAIYEFLTQKKRIFLQQKNLHFCHEIEPEFVSNFLFYLDVPHPDIKLPSST